MTTPTKPPGKKAPSITMQSDTMSGIAALYASGFTSRFSMSSLAALYTSKFAQGFSNNERQASIRALLRHDAHIDGTHYQKKTAGGLHPSYISFNPTVEQTDQKVLTQDDLLEAALQDVFDAITMQDRLDGGISLLIRCAGIEAGPNISPEQVPIDLYITPRELQETDQRIGGDIAILVQAFAQEFAVPHLHRFMQRCAAEKVKPPKHFPAAHINPNGPQYLPAPMVATGARTQCSAQAPHAFASALEAPSDANNANTPSAAIRHGVTSTTQYQIRQRRPADVFLRSRNPGDRLAAPILSGQGKSDILHDSTNLVGPALISVGPNTDAVLDRFKLGDEMLPKLRVLASTVRSSRWESVFRSPTWDLSYEQASLLSRALLADLQGVPLNPDVVKPPSASVLTSILKILGILVFSYPIYALMVRYFVYRRPTQTNTPLTDYPVMVTQSFYATKRTGGPRRVQVPLRTRPKVSLSKEARAALRSTQREKSRLFKDALDDAWNQIDQATKTIAVSHHKSIRRVENNLYFGRGILRSRRVKPNLWNAFCWKKNQEKENGGLGKAALQSLVRDHKDEYHALSKDEQDELLKEYVDSRETKTTGLRISAKSKVNDITQTLKVIENELNSLRCRTGAETILYTTRGSTDLPLRGVSFATEGVQKFMGSVMGIDSQDLVSKMEGFAVQGMKGAAKNHQQRVSGLRASIRDTMNSKLQEVTGDDRAKMQWVHYFRNVIQRYQVVVEGWPTNIPFTNLSNVSSAIPDLEMLLRKWESGATYWKAIDDEEFERLRRERDEGLESGDITEQRRRTRSDKGKKHRQPAGTQNGRKTAHKSAEFIGTDDEQDEPHHQSPVAQPASAEFVDDEQREPHHQSPVAQPAALPSTTSAPESQLNALEFSFSPPAANFQWNAPQFNFDAPQLSFNDMPDFDYPPMDYNDAFAQLEQTLGPGPLLD